ncbi:hypothetical protein BGW38_003347 [Lunasporangiospora selenospora]|uniref:Uncharacterized protein n=1 Tax=Lunasporangiospora selenospora TaxID=979761 RepID=A0A9P6KCS4_9FUNG|nr:hypothetical protein BGW38_003347 [Lunasporangiospora selenospora]
MLYHPDQDFEDASKELDGCTTWTDLANDMVWVILPSLFNYDEFKAARLSGKGEDYVKSNCTFYAPYSQLYNKRTWVYREATNKSVKAES